jgi:MYXO-CTERM domain-containing protein
MPNFSGRSPSFRITTPALLAGALLLASPTAFAARDMMSADGPGDTYQLLERSYGIEVPDCKHMVPHMTEVMDDELKKPVFVFHAHVNQDDDRCMNSDRQRTEIRGRASGVQGPEGSTRHYRWLMKLPAGFQPSGNFTHVFQIKAYGNGHGSGAPIMTLTPRNGTFGIDGRIGTRASTQLSNVLNQWVIIELTIVHSNGGRLAMNIKRWRDGMMLLSYSGNADMYDDGAGYGAPKFGIYRSLNSAGSLRDEQVRFADFCVSNTSVAECADGAQPPPPPPGDGGAPPPADGGAAPDAGPAGEDAAGGTGGSGGAGGSGGSGGTGGGGTAGGNTGSGGTGATGSGGSGGAGGSGATGTGGSSGTGGTGGSSPPRRDAGGNSNPDPQPGGGKAPSGGCNVAGGTSGSGPGLLLLLLGLAVLRRRRR